MGFLDDILEIGKEFSALREEVTSGIAEAINSVAEPIQGVKDSINDSSNALMGVVDESAVVADPVSSSSPSEE